MSVITVPAGVTSHPHFVPAGSIVKVSPAAGASAIVEYTTASPVGIKNGVATWVPWPKGTIAADASDLAYNPVSVRVTTNGASATVEVNINPSAADVSAFKGDWAGAARSPIAANTLAVIGDSINARWAFDSGLIRQTFSRGWLFWMMSLTQQRFTIVGDFSVSNSRIITAGGNLPMISQQIDQAIATGAGYLILEGGINDLNAGTSVAAVQAALTAIIKKAIAAGMRIFWTTLLPFGGAPYTTSNNNPVLQLNDWIRQQANYVYAQQGVTLIDMYSIVVDPLSTSGWAKSGYLLPADQLHPVNVGAYFMGKEAARIVNKSVPEVPRLLSSLHDAKANNSASTNCYSGGLFTGAAVNGVAGGFSAVAITGTPTSVNSVVARADGYGNDQQMVVTFSAAGDVFVLAGPSAYSRLVSGKTYVLDCEVTVVTPGALRDVCVDLRLENGGAIVQQSGWNDVTQGTNGAMPEACTIQVSTRPFVYAGAAGDTFRSMVSLAGASAGSATVKIGRMSIREVA